MVKTRKKMKNTTSALAAIMLAIGAFSACSAPPPSEEGFSAEDLQANINANIAKDTSANLKIAIRANDSEEVIVKGLIDEFNAEYPNIRITPVRVNGDAYDTTLASYVPAGTMPDLFWVNPNNLAYYYNNGVAFTLDNYIKESGLDVSAYVQAAMNECQSNVGHYYMLPRDYVQLVMYYNKSLMSELISRSEKINEMPSADWTWNDFLEICGEFKNTGIIGDNYPVLDVELRWEAVYYPFIRSFGGEIVNKEGNVVLEKGLEEDPQSNGAYRYLGELLRMKQRKFILGQETATGASTNYYGGFSPFYIHSRSSLTDAYAAFSTLEKEGKASLSDLGVLPMPAIGEEPSVSAGCTGYAIYRDGKNKDAAWAFLKFMMTEKGQEALSRTGNIVPVMISEREKENPVWKQYPQGLSVDHDMFIAHAERGIGMDFLRQLPTETHAEALNFMRAMQSNVLYNNGNREEQIQLAADAMYNLLAYGK